jgi:hypothetical protein
VGPVIEGSGPNHHHPQYGEMRPARGGGTIDGDDIEHRASYCMNLEASKVKTRNERKGAGGPQQASRESTSDARDGEKASQTTPSTEIKGADGSQKASRDSTSSANSRRVDGTVETTRGDVSGGHDGRTEGGGDANGPRRVRLDIPLAVPRDGRNYTKCAPLSATVSFGTADTKCLMDPDSNTSIVDFDKLRASYPDVVINDSVQIAVHGVGQASTVGWVVLPVTIHARDADGPVNVEMDVEWHVMRNFKPGLLLGLDTMLDYDIDLCLSDLTGTAHGFRFDLDVPYRPFRSVLVKTSRKVTVPGRTATVIPVTSAMVSGFDYVIDPFYTAMKGVTCGPQLPKGIADATMDKMVYVNDTDHPLVLDKYQAIARATMATVDTRIVETALRMDWADLVKPSTRARDVGAKAPAAFDLDALQHVVLGSSSASLETAQSATWFASGRCYEDELCFTADGREKPRRPRSIPDADAARLAATAPRRQPSDEFAVPPDDPEMELPSVELPGVSLETILDSDFIIDPGLDDNRRQDLLGLLKDVRRVLQQRDATGQGARFPGKYSTERRQQRTPTATESPSRPGEAASGRRVHRSNVELGRHRGQLESDKRRHSFG